MAPVVTLSASFGAGGSLIGPRVAERLGLPFLDRAIPVAVAEALAVPMADAMAYDERRKTGMGRALASLARAAAAPDTVFGTAPTARTSLSDQPEQAFRDETERVLHQIAETRGGVILGRAGAIVLANERTALHVRLDAAVERRVARATAYEGVDEAVARKRLAETDRAREGYVKHFYKVDARDPCHYHLVIDSTTLDIDTCVELIVCAAKARNAVGPTAVEG